MILHPVVRVVLLLLQYLTFNYYLLRFLGGFCLVFFVVVDLSQ